MTDLLAPGGGLAQAIPHYEDRPEQRAMSAAVATALAEARPLIVEAGTGTGKTLAYLVPALASGRRVVVSTGTRTLQDQIARHDVPLLRTLVDRPFTAVSLKGVSNYVCRRKLIELLRSPSLPAAAGAIAEWVDDSETGDRAEVDWLGEDDPIWPEITTTPDTRIGPRCPHFESCFVTQARRRAEKADLILVNHHLYFADLALRAASPGARVLPDHDAVVFDEAHQLEDVITEHFGARVSTVRIAQLVRDARLALAGGLFERQESAESVAAHVDRAATGLFARVRQHLVGDENRVPLPADLLTSGDRQEAWFRLDHALEELARRAEQDAEPPPPGADEDEQELARRVQAGALARRARGVRDDLAIIAEQRAASHVYWGELRAGGGTFLSASPIDVADIVRRHVVRGDATAVFTSATLSAAGTFSYTRARLGLDHDEVDELAVASPFDYARQALLYVPRDLPAPTADGYIAAACTRIAELCTITAGRAFILFTSHRALKAARALLSHLPHPLLVQGSEPRAALIDRFRATPGAVLLGTGSFWEGVDVPGDALSLVAIDRLPFAPHTDPLVAARMRRVSERGGEPFDEIQVPAAALTLKQGFGRLIRRRDDRGVVAVLDPRIVTKSYGRAFLASLPSNLPRTSALEQVRRWFHEVGRSEGQVRDVDRLSKDGVEEIAEAVGARNRGVGADEIG